MPAWGDISLGEARPHEGPGSPTLLKRCLGYERQPKWRGQVQPAQAVPLVDR